MFFSRLLEYEERGLWSSKCEASRSRKEGIGRFSEAMKGVVVCGLGTFSRRFRVLMAAGGLRGP